MDEPSNINNELTEDEPPAMDPNIGSDLIQRSDDDGSQHILTVFPNVAPSTGESQASLNNLLPSIALPISPNMQTSQSSPTVAPHVLMEVEESSNPASHAAQIPPLVASPQFITQTVPLPPPVVLENMVQPAAAPHSLSVETNESPSVPDVRDGTVPLQASLPEPQAAAPTSGPNTNETGNENSPSRGTTSFATNGGGTVRLRVPPGAHIHLVGPNGATRRVSANTNGSIQIPRSTTGSAAGRGPNIHVTTNNGGIRVGGPMHRVVRGPRGGRNNTNHPVGSQPSGGRVRHRVVNLSAQQQGPGNGHPPVELYTTTIPPAIPSVSPVRLEPHVLPDSRQDLVETETTISNQDASNDADLEEFKCAICWEFMTKPQGHSGCTSRFCETCVERLREQVRVQNPPARIRCPTCRQIITDFQVDSELSDRITQTHKIPCRFASCDAEPMSLSQVAQHEAVCQAVKVSCRYSRLGCDWTGPKRDLQSHEEDDCALAKVSGLVEQHINLQNANNQLQARMQGSFQMQQVLQHQVQNLAQAARLQQEMQQSFASPNNPMHVAEYVITLFTNTLGTCPHRWKYMETVEAKSGTFNQLMLVPTILVTVRYGSMKMALFSVFKHEELELMDILDIMASCSAAFMGCIIIILMFWLDRHSSLAWKDYKIPARFGGSQKLGLLVSSLCAEMLFGLIFLDVREAAGFGYTLFFYVVLVFNSTFLPILFSALAAPRQPENDTLENKLQSFALHGRAAITIHIGLGLGFLWGSSDSQFPELQLILTTILLFCVQLKLPRQIAISIAIAAVAIVAAIDMQSVALAVISGAFGLTTQAIITASIVVFASKSEIRPRPEILLLTALFGWAQLCALL
mmetsp:Transcript_3429/g.7112  ORF Transcript_3429/g.7112 Transcript_3429/m.7112 type:complete len:858 (-) Transcript_3429:508-3081(-)